MPELFLGPASEGCWRRMRTAIKPCRVPWSVSPTMDGLTLHHVSDVSPQCTIVFGGGRLTADSRTDSRRIELVFPTAQFVRVGAKRDDEEIGESGFEVVEACEGGTQDYLQWRERRWRETGFCPDSGLYVATVSPWCDAIKTSGLLSQTSPRHYVLAGRDSYIELLAERFSWREWLWLDGPRDAHCAPGDVVGSGSGVA